MNWREFKPTIFFILRFLGLYLAGNLIYGLYTSSFEPVADPVTILVSNQTALTLNSLGWQCTTHEQRTKPTVTIAHEAKPVLSVYEGCNGINVMIIFVAFVIAFGPMIRAMMWFIPLGFFIIHLGNLLRLVLLFFVSQEFPGALYFSHKYLFTAFIYAVVFLLWMIWVNSFSLSGKNEKA